MYKNMEKIVITPKEVRALGNIVSPKSKNDFQGSKISQGTATVQGIPSTVYTSTYLPVSRLTVTGEHYIQSDKKLILHVTVRDNNNNPIRSGKVYCVTDTKTHSATIQSNGTCELTIKGLIDGLHTLKIYYPGSSSIGGSFRNFSVVVGDELNLTILGIPQVLQPNDYSELFGFLTSMDIGVPGVRVDFYEEFILSFIKLFSSESLFKIGDTVDITAKVSDSDGSGIPGQLVQFYEEFNINFDVYSTPEVIQTGEYSEVLARLFDSDGSPILNQQVKFYEEYTPGILRVNASDRWLQTGGTVDIRARLGDIDNSAIPDTQVDFYEYFDYSNLTVRSTSTLILPTETVDITARLQDEDGSGIRDTQVDFYEYFELDSLTVKADPPVIAVGDTTDLTSVLKDADGSRVRDERVDYSVDVESIDWSIQLNNPPQVIMVEDTVDITASVRDEDNTAVSGVYVRFYG